VAVSSAQQIPAIAQDPPPDKEFPASTEAPDITSHGVRLNAVFYLASGRGPNPAVLLMHGFPGNEQNMELQVCPSKTVSLKGCSRVYCAQIVPTIFESSNLTSSITISPQQVTQAQHLRLSDLARLPLLFCRKLLRLLSVNCPNKNLPRRKCSALHITAAYYNDVPRDRMRLHFAAVPAGSQETAVITGSKTISFEMRPAHAWQTEYS
jgi:hypothetical protein